MTSRRANGEGSIFPYRNGFAAYVWITTPSGKRQRKIRLRTNSGDSPQPVGGAHAESRARAGCHQGADSWAVPPSMARRHGCSEPCPAHVRDVREPREELHRAWTSVRCGLIDLRVADVQAWLNRLATQCQCCAQGKDVRRALRGTARCCALGKCCHQVASPRTIKDVRTVLRSALHSAVRQELIDRNVAQLVQIPSPRRTGARWPPTSRPTRNGCWPSSPAGSARRRLANEGSDPVLRWMRFDARRPPSRPEKSSLTPASTAGIAGVASIQSRDRQHRSAYWSGVNRRGSYAILRHRHLRQVLIRAWKGSPPRFGQPDHPRSAASCCASDRNCRADLNKRDPLHPDRAGDTPPSISLRNLHTSGAGKNAVTSDKRAGDGGVWKDRR